MSARLFPDDILFLQRFLSCGGFYRGALDGEYGPQTATAEAACDNAAARIAAAEGSFDRRSEGNIAGLQIDAQPLARRSLAALLAGGHGAKIISGTRTYAQQNALYRQGRSASGSVVTNARGGQSWHNFGLAWDIGLFRDGVYLTDSTPYERASEVAKVAGLEWGGDWTGFKDTPHYQLATGGVPVSVARTAFEAGGRA
jgi:peptidoglycan L-alanyl-D-glutamate endopeptidase CwlK